MTTKYKNKVTVYFDKERTKILRVFLHTLEQTNVFIMFIRRCTTLQYVAYTQESYKNNSWHLVNDQELSISPEFSQNRADAAPFRLVVSAKAGNKHEVTTFDMYFFSSLDIDYAIQLLLNGTKSSDLSFSAYIRDRDTREWNNYIWNKGIPNDVASTYLSLGSESREHANEYINKLTHV